ncbi:MAG: sulfotransferase [Melioribacteraceae bacterium]|nr:sulfotransferase [Melioribacteraceae bacterium]
MAKKKKYVFIFGLQRSGSTFIYRTLGAHPNIDVSPNDFNLNRLFGDMRLTEIKQLQKLIEWGPDCLDSIKDIKKPESILKKFLVSYFRNIKSKNKVAIHKTPKGEYDLNIYRKAFTNSKYIYTIRNPIQILASKKHWKVNRPKFSIDIENNNIDKYIDLLKEFKKQIQLIHKTIEIVDQNFSSDDTLHVISYDDFLKNTDFVIGKIFDKLRLKIYKFDELQPQSFIYDSGSSFSNSVDYQVVNQEKLDKWKTVLTDSEKLLIHNEMLDFYKSLKNTRVKIIFKGYINEVKQHLMEIGHG